MSNNFIIADNSKANSLDEELSRLPFRDKETLVQMYNSGLINRSAPQVTELVDALMAAYKGIEKRADGITFLDSGEIAADELISKAEAYRFALRLQRIIKDAIRDGHLLTSSLIFIQPNGKIAVAGSVNEDGDYEYSETQDYLAEKLPKINADVIGHVAGLLSLGKFDYEISFSATQALGVKSDPVLNALGAIS